MGVDSGFIVPDHFLLPGARLEEAYNLPGFHYPAHAHDELYLTLTVSGNLVGSWCTGTNLRRPGSVTIIPTGATHALTVEEPSRSFQVVLGTGWVQRYDVASVFPPQPSVTEDSIETWVAGRLFAEFKSRDLNCGIALESALQDVMDLAIWRQKQRDSSASPSWLSRLDELLRASLREPQSAAELARNIGLDPAYMMRRFRTARRCTIGEHVRRLRLEHACRLLARTTSSIGEVAHESGFSDHSHLTRHFRARFSVTPTEFREQRRR